MLMTGTNPKRLRLSRERGFSIEALSRNTNDRDVVNVTRPGFWGNWICVGSPGRLWIKNGAPRNLQTTLTAELPEVVDQARAVAVHRYWLDTDTSSAMDASRSRAWMIPGFEKLDQNFQTLAEHELLLKRRNTLAQLPSLAGAQADSTSDGVVMGQSIQSPQAPAGSFRRHLHFEDTIWSRGLSRFSLSQPKANLWVAFHHKCHPS